MEAETGSNLDYAFPEGLHPSLQGLAWLVGSWQGFGQTQWHDEADQRVLEQVDFSHNGQPYLHYLLQSFVDDDGRQGEPVHMETGFFIPGEGNQVSAVIASPAGVAQRWFGTVTGLKSVPGGQLGTRIELTTDAALSQGQHTAGHRLFGLVQGKLMFAYDRADQDVPLGPWLTGELERR